MNEEYLWDRSGDDTEIERLEDLLQDLRYRPTAAPTLPSPRRWWQNVQILTGLTATAAIAIIASFIYFSPLRSETVRTARNEQVETPVVAPSTAAAAPTSPLTEQRPTYSNALFVRRPRAKAVKRTKPPVVLTAEEKHAYDQVVFALYVTGSKLRSVRDTIDVMEKNNKSSNDK